MRFAIDTRDYKTLKSGDKLSAIGLGTWAIRDYKRAERVLVEAVSRGLNLIDTAEMYDDGRAEELVGRVVRVVGRDNVFITTKLLPYRFRSLDSAIKAIRASLSRLGVREVDLVLIHWPDYLTPVEHQVRVLEELARLGYARHIGVSNFSRSELERAIHATRVYDVEVNQVHYSVLHKHEVENELLPLALREDIVLQAYTPLERCRVAKHPTIVDIARRVNRTPVQVALNYLISRPNVVAIPKTERMEHLEDILGALGWRLPSQLIEEIERIPDELEHW